MKNCPFCQQNIKAMDYKNATELQRYISSQRKIYSSKRTGLCQKHQRLLANTIKRARFMAYLSFVR